MEESILQIDISKTNYEEDENFLKIRLKTDEILQINYIKLIKQSKYFRDKYNYSEALTSIQDEIDEIKDKHKIDEESVKHFIQVIQDEKIRIPMDHYRDLFILSKYFHITKLTKELTSIMQNKLSSDINFSIQMLQDSETTDNEYETDLTSKIENFLITHINECILNAKFGYLQISTIYRILNKSDKKIVNNNSLVDFILESADTRFVLLKFVELNKLETGKIDEFIEFIDEESEETREMILEYMPFNFLYIKEMKNKYDQLLGEFKLSKEEINQTKNELNQTKQKFDQVSQELNQTKQKFDQVSQELNQTKQKFDQASQELNQTKQKFDQASQELNQTKQKFDQASQELNQTKIKLKQTKDDLDKSKQCAQSILVGGFDQFNQLGEKPNNEDKNKIHPATKLFFDSSSHLSYSIYFEHSVIVTSSGSLMGVGNNDGGRISATIQKTDIDHFTEFCIKDGSGRQLEPVSAACSFYGTLYMFRKSDGSGRQLVLCDSDINGGTPVFLDIGNSEPVSLFSGWYHLSAISDRGEVIFISRYSVKNSPNSRIAAVSLPNGEKALSIACCNDSAIVLSSNGRVFESPVTYGSRALKFSEVFDLSGQEIICVSGTNGHFLAVSKEGRVFCRGSNNYGQLGLGEGTRSVSSFTEITSLGGYKIRSASAGGWHSLFVTREGKVFSCGYNKYDELLLSNVPKEEKVYTPTATTITSDASFCIAGDLVSVVFIGGNPPPNTPNTGIQQDH